MGHSLGSSHFNNNTPLSTSWGPNVKISENSKLLLVLCCALAVSTTSLPGLTCFFYLLADT